MKEALLYERLGGGKVHCFLCAHHCRIPEGQFGICGVRENAQGLLYTRVYAQPVAANVDPIEKKPLYHFLPGSTSFSIATIGCNFRCGFCQNWEISQAKAVKPNASFRGGEVLPGAVVKAALQHKCRSISYTYTEPTVFFEYALETAQVAQEAGLRNVFVTNGYMTPEALRMVAPYLDAANIDLKFFKEESYRKVCGASLEPVLGSIRLMKELGIWVEVTTLVIPGENDSEEELGAIAQFLAGLDRDMPWHISRFHPEYEFGDRAVTPQESLRQAEDIALSAGLRYVYVGNVYGWGGRTSCPSCAKALITREGFNVLENNIKEGACAFCGARIAGVFA